MNPLSPSRAAEIASRVYDVQVDPSVGGIDEGGLGLSGQFSLSGGGRFTGASGSVVFKKRTGFGYVAWGEGPREGEALVAIRGTASVFDGITDANQALRTGPTGLPVHAGFADTFKSFHGEIQKAFGARRPSHVHCVGHSLGGALATLAADAVSGMGLGTTLYTFGSPRVGLDVFSRDLTSRLGEHNIHRVYHDADPVGMVPIFPFLHVPHSDPSHHLKYNGWRVSLNAHFMESYRKSVKGAAWSSLPKSRLEPSLGEKIDDWLDSNPPGGGMYSSYTLWMIQKALVWIIDEVAPAAGGLALLGAVTVLDQLAWLLHRAAQAIGDIADSLEALIRKIFEFLGRPLSRGVSLSVGFLRWVLDMLFSTVAGMAQQAIARLM